MPESKAAARSWHRLWPRSAPSVWKVASPSESASPAWLILKPAHVTMAVNLGIGSHPYPLAAEIGAALGFPVTIENDVRAAALGAHETPAARRASRPRAWSMVSIGTGIRLAS